MIIGVATQTLILGTIIWRTNWEAQVKYTTVCIDRLREADCFDRLFLFFYRRAGGEGCGAPEQMVLEEDR